MGAAPQDELLLVSSSEAGAIADRLQLAAPQLRIRCLRSSNGRLRSLSAALVVIYETSANGGYRPPIDVERVPTLVLAEHPSPVAALAAIEQGIDGYLAADISAQALAAAVTAVLQGELAYSRQTLGAWLRSLRVQTRGRDRVSLTPRQTQIVELIATGATDKEIAATIGVATATAQKHVARLLKRLGVRNRAAAVAARRLPGSRARLTG